MTSALVIVGGDGKAGLTCPLKLHARQTDRRGVRKKGCLSRNIYRPEKCDEYVRKLYMCCLEMYKMEGDNAESTACSSKAVIERWWKRHEERR